LGEDGGGGVGVGGVRGIKGEGVMIFKRLIGGVRLIEGRGKEGVTEVEGEMVGGTTSPKVR